MVVGSLVILLKSDRVAVVRSIVFDGLSMSLARVI